MNRLKRSPLHARHEQAGAQLLSPAKQMPWGDRNARVQTPDGMQVTLYQAASAGDA